MSKRAPSFAVVLALAVVARSDFATRAQAQDNTITLTAIPLGPAVKDEAKTVFTADSSRSFIIAPKGSRVQAWVDGFAGPPVRDVVLKQDTHDMPKGTPSLPFSPDGRRVAYIAMLDGGKQAVTVDGTQSRAYDKIGWLQFAPVGHHIVYQATDNADPTDKRQEHGFSVRIVDDGKEGPAFDGIGGLVLSEDGQHVAYAAMKKPFLGMRNGYGQFGKNETHIMLDGQELTKPYANAKELRLSADGKHLAFLTRSENFTGSNFGWAVINGQESRKYSDVEQLTMSRDGSRIAFVARSSEPNNAGARVIDNGKEGAEYASVSDIVLSPHGEHLAYFAQRSGGNLSERLVVDNGAESPPYERCDRLSISPDGNTVTFTAKASQGDFFVVNGEEYGPFERIGTDLTYSPDGKHWVISVTPPQGQFSVLVDGKVRESPIRYGSISFTFTKDNRLLVQGMDSTKSEAAFLDPEESWKGKPLASAIVLSPNQEHIARVMGNGDKKTLSLDGRSMGSDSYLRIQNIRLTDDGKHAAYAGSISLDLTQGSACVNVDGQAGPRFSEVRAVALSPDGRHVAYAAEEKQEGGRAFFVALDGMKGPSFDKVILPGYYTKTDAVKFLPDGSLTFLAESKGQIFRYRYPPESIKAAPTLQAMGAVTLGPRILQEFQDTKPSALLRGPDDVLYGTVPTGGKYRQGILFKMQPDGSNFEVLHEFEGGDLDVSQPSSLIPHPDGAIYGGAVTGGGGGYGHGGIFRFEPAKKTYSILKIAEPSREIARLAGAMTDGTLYGFNTRLLDPNHQAIFTVTPDGSHYRQIRADQQVEGWTRLIGSIVTGKDGLYAVNSEALLKFKSFDDPQPEVVHKFVKTPSDGFSPESNLQVAKDGVLYGTTRQGGIAGKGVIYRVSPGGSNYQVIYNPEKPQFAQTFVVADDGMLYGANANGVCRLPADGSVAEPTTVLAYKDAPQNSSYEGLKPLFFDGSYFDVSQRGIVIMPLPRPDRVGALTPRINIDVLSPAPMVTEPFAFAASDGTVRAAFTPRANTPPESFDAATSPPNVTPAAIRARPRSNTDTRLEQPANPTGAPAYSGGDSGASAIAADFVQAFSDPDVEALAALYADTVDYADSGRISNAAVRAQAQEYFERWPVRQWTLTGPVKVTSLGASVQEIVFSARYELSDPQTSRHTSGIAKETLTLAADNSGAMKIISHHEQITGQGNSSSNDKKPRRSNRGGGQEKIYQGRRVDPNSLPPLIPWPFRP